MSTLGLTRRRASLRSILTIIVALVSGIALYSYLSWVRSQVPISGPLVPLVVAASDLEPGTVLSKEMLEIVDHPSRYLPAGAFGSLDRVVGKTLSVPLFKGEPITGRKIASSGGLSSVVPEGMRAYSLALTSGSGLNFVPRAGDRVDVIVTLPKEVAGEATATTVLRSKQVASVGKQPSATSSGSKLGITQGGQGGLAITLFITPAEAERLALAESLGRITVVLAPDEQESQAAREPAKIKDLGSQ